MTSPREIELRLGEEAVEGARQKKEGKKMGSKNQEGERALTARK